MARKSNKSEMDRNSSVEGSKKSSNVSNYSSKRAKNYRDKSKRSTNRECDTTDRYRNDPKWYYSNAAVTDAAIRINFEEFVGKRYDVGNSHFEPLNVLTYYCNPTPNLNWEGSPFKEVQDPGALWAARKLYAALSSVTGRTSNYTPSTLCFMFYAVGEMLSTYSFIRRVFGYYRTYNRRNWGIPDSLLSGMNVLASDFRSNIANYLTEFNTIIVDMAKLPILGNVTYFQKCVAMYDYIYADLDADMAQLFMLCPATTWYLREDGGSVYPGVTGTVLETVPMCLSDNSNSGNRELSYYLGVLRQQVNYLLESSTLNIVYSDILNYASKNGAALMTLPQVLPEYSESVIYNAKVNQQMHHAMLRGWYSTEYDIDTVASIGLAHQTVRDIATGETREVQFTPRNDVIETGTSYSYVPMTEVRIPLSEATDITNKYWDPTVMQALMYDADHMDETLDERVDNTRYMLYRYLMFLSEQNTASRKVYCFCQSGDHSVVRAVMLTAEPNDNGIGVFAKSDVPAAFTESAIRVLTRFQALDLPPLMWVFNRKALGDEMGYELAGPVGDLKDTTFLQPEMFVAANQLIERDLLDVRDLKGFSG
nr:putative capsid [Marmot picobirnavirus]